MSPWLSQTQGFITVGLFDGFVYLPFTKTQQQKVSGSHAVEAS